MFGEQSMAKILDFKTKYAPKIFAIDPGFSTKGGCGWAMINTNAEYFGKELNVPVIHRSGVIKPFSTASNLITMSDICKKIEEIWRHDSGYSEEPAVLVIEQPEIYPNSPVRFSNISDLSIFVGMLLCSLSPKLTLAPTAREWKGNKKKADTQVEIEKIQDYHSKKALERDFSMIAIHNRHHIYDALGLGIYGAEVEFGSKPLPRLYL